MSHMISDEKSRRLLAGRVVAIVVHVLDLVTTQRADMRWNRTSSRIS